MNIAMILAGGVGSRVGANKPKQFIEILGKPIIVYTLEKFQNNENIDAIEVVSIESHREYIEELIKKYKLSKVKWITTGGKTFQESTMKGIYNLEDKLDENDNLLIHFAVSPMVSDEIINDAIRVCNLNGNAIAADEMIMCTCIKDDEHSSSQGIPRESIIGLNGPWSFKYGYVNALYKEADKLGILDTVDPHTTSIMFELGHKVYFSKSATNNIKITRKEDLELFEGWLLYKQKHQKEQTKEESNHVRL